MGAIHTNCDPAVLMVVETKHVARRVVGSPRESNIESQVRRRRALETARPTPTSCLDGPMEPAPTEPVGAPDTSWSATLARPILLYLGRFSNNLEHPALFTSLFRTLIMAFFRPKIRLAPLPYHRTLLRAPGPPTPPKPPLSLRPMWLSW